MATFTEQSDYVLNSLTDRGNTAETMLRITQTLIESARLAIGDAIAAYQDLGVTIDVSGVDTTYVAPTATYPTLPTANSLAISDARWDQIFVRAAAQELRAGVAEAQAAASEAAMRGMAVPSVVATGMLSMAQQRAMDRASLNAETSAIEQEKAEREDSLSVAKLGIEGYVGQWNARTQSELARIQFETLELKKVVDPETVRANYDLKLVELAQANSVQQLVDLVQVYAQLTNALYSASDVSLSAGASISLGYPFKYNPAAGEVVQSAA